MSSEHPPDITQLLQQVDAGQQQAADQLLPLVYDELRRLARSRLRHLSPGQTLEATALVHEAWLKLVGDQDPGWNHRGHFFAAAAQAMREILVDRARKKSSHKRGGDLQRIELPDELLQAQGAATDLLELDRVLGQLEEQRPRHHRVVLLRYFAGLTVPAVAEVLGVSAATVDRDWAFARAWLHRALAGPSP